MQRIYLIKHLAMLPLISFRYGLYMIMSTKSSNEQSTGLFLYGAVHWIAPNSYLLLWQGYYYSNVSAQTEGLIHYSWAKSRWYPTRTLTISIMKDFSADHSTRPLREMLFQTICLHIGSSSATLLSPAETLLLYDEIDWKKTLKKIN